MCLANNKSEQLDIRFLGMKFNSVNPGKKTIIILLILLVFFLISMVLLKSYVSPIVTTLGSAKAIIKGVSKASVLKKLIFDKSP